MQHCKSIMAKFFFQGMTKTVRLTFSVGDTAPQCTIVLCKAIRIGDTKYSISVATTSVPHLSPSWTGMEKVRHFLVQHTTFTLSHWNLLPIKVAPFPRLPHQSPLFLRPVVPAEATSLHSQNALHIELQTLAFFVILCFWDCVVISAASKLRLGLPEKMAPVAVGDKVADGVLELVGRLTMVATVSKSTNPWRARRFCSLVVLLTIFVNLRLSLVSN